MSKKRILVLDHQPEQDLLEKLARQHDAEVVCANGYLHAVAKAIRMIPDTVYIRRDLPWLRRASSPLVFLDNPAFAGVGVVFYTPDELRGEWPSQNMHRPEFA